MELFIDNSLLNVICFIFFIFGFLGFVGFFIFRRNCLFNNLNLIFIGVLIFDIKNRLFFYRD